MILISVFDKKSSHYLPPMAYEHVSQAIRSYMMAARKQPDSTQFQFPEDFDLYQVGEFDEVSGAVDPVIPPHFVESLISIVSQARKEFQPNGKEARS